METQCIFFRDHLHTLFVIKLEFVSSKLEFVFSKLEFVFLKLEFVFSKLEFVFSKLVEQGNTPIYKHIKLLSHYSNISNNEFDIPSIIFERFAYLKPTPKAYMLKIAKCPPLTKQYYANLGKVASIDQKSSLSIQTIGNPTMSEVLQT